MKLKHYALDADNQVIEIADLIAWAHWFEHANRIVGYTQITSEIYVSTVFLGLDHRIWGEGPPLLFETIIFGGPLDPLDYAMWRYSSWDDADTGHRAAVAKARKAIGQRVSQ